MSDLRTLFTPHEEVEGPWNAAEHSVGALAVVAI